MTKEVFLVIGDMGMDGEFIEAVFFDGQKADAHAVTMNNPRPAWVSYYVDCWADGDTRKSRDADADS